MVFYPPSWVPKLPFDPPDDVSIPDFMLSEKSGRRSLKESRDPFVCGLSGKSYTNEQVVERVDFLARGIAKENGWAPNKGTEWDKCVGLFSLNAIDYIPLTWAIHKLGGLCTPANAAYSPSEVEFQMKDAGAKCLFTCAPLLESVIGVAQKLGIPKEKIYLVELPKEATGGKPTPKGFKTVDDLIKLGSKEPKLETLKWSKGDGAKRVAFLCYSSGTSGLPKGVKISHRNVISNTMQISIYDGVYRHKNKGNNEKPPLESCLGLLPLSHIYGLVVVAHASTYVGDSVIVLPKFEMASCLSAIQDYKINTLYIVPPILILFEKNKKVLDKYDLTQVRSIFTGAAPLGEETAEGLQKQYPKWLIRQGYGMTETCTVVCSTSQDDIWFGSSGSLVPGFEARIVTVDGKEITGYDQPGELWAKSPSCTLGYHNNEKATAESYIEDGWVRTGDEVVIRKSPKGHEHIFVVDRIKELIKVKGLQVAPAELEAHLLAHPAVNDCCVIPVPDDSAGEVPKAFVVKSPNAGGIEDSDRILAREIQKHVEAHKSRHKWLKGGVEFIDEIPKSPSGKILRRKLRDKEKEARRKKGAKI